MSGPRVDLHDDWLRVHLGRGGHLDVHHRWLRHQCDGDRHPTTGERTLDTSELPDDLRATAALIDGDALVVTWSHGDRVSRFAIAWLEEHAYARDRVEVPRPPSDVELFTVTGGASLDDDVERAQARLAERGAAIVRRAPGRTTAPEDETEVLIAAFERAGLSVIGTHFGRIEDLRTDNTTNANTDQLGYTDAAVDVHTDQPFLDHPPRWQLLQSIRAADLGGDNALVDVAAVVDWLRAHDARTLEILSTVPVRFHRKQKAFESVVVAPILDPGGAGPLVRYSYFTTAPQKLPFERMTEWYRAYDTFGRLVREPRHQVRFGLRPGDFLVYDNHRMLHARTAFRGARWVRGVYFDRA